MSRLMVSRTPRNKPVPTAIASAKCWKVIGLFMIFSSLANLFQREVLFVARHYKNAFLRRCNVNLRRASGRCTTHRDFVDPSHVILNTVQMDDPHPSFFSPR